MPGEFDLIIRNGMIADGTGKARFRGDLGVVGERVAEIGAISGEAQAREVVDAEGMVVAPGFIDIHTHADIALLARPEHLPKVMQGVTTEVFTNCGLGFAPINDLGMDVQRRYIAGLFGDDGGMEWSWRSVAEFLGRFEARGIGANVAYLIPHGAARVSVMGMEERAADTGELHSMVGMVERGMEEGAWGLSTGIWYAPMRAAGREELVALCRAAGFFAMHQRDYGERIFEATAESLEIARAAGVPVQIAHLQMNGAGNAGRAPELLELLEGAIREGVDASWDTYPYTAGSTFVQSLLPVWATEGGPEGVLKFLGEAESRARITAHLEVSVSEWDRFQLVGASSSANAGYEGMRFDAIAERRGLSVAELVCRVLEEEELRACYVHHAAHEGNVREILRSPHQMVGSDGLHLPGKTHPRLYGTFPRVLGRYVREERVLSLEEAVRKMTGAPAARLGLVGRGILEVGSFADITIFDPATVCDTATFEEPLRYPVGIPYVFVNGRAVKRADAPTGALPGRVLRK